MLAVITTERLRASSAAGGCKLLDEGAYTLQIKCRLPVTDLFLRCPPSAPKESRRSPGAPPAGAHTAERLRASSAAGGYKLLDEGVYTLQIKCRLPITDLFPLCPSSAPKEPRRSFWGGVVARRRTIVGEYTHAIACTASIYGYSCCHAGWSWPRAITTRGEQLSSSFSRDWHRFSRIGPDLIGAPRRNGGR